MKRATNLSLLIFALASILVSPAPARANSGPELIPFRLGVSFGGWEGSLTETFGSQSSTLRIKPAWAGTLLMGLALGPAFVDWSPTYFAVGKIGSSDNGSNCSYVSLLSGEAGVSIRLFDDFSALEPYVGYESGKLAFANGTGSEFDGNALKAGVNLALLRTSPFAHFGLRAELRKHYLSLQNSGTAPIGVSTTSAYLGVVLVFQGR